MSVDEAERTRTGLTATLRNSGLRKLDVAEVVPGAGHVSSEFPTTAVV